MVRNLVHLTLPLGHTWGPHIVKKRKNYFFAGNILKKIQGKNISSCKPIFAVFFTAEK